MVDKKELDYKAELTFVQNLITQDGKAEPKDCSPEVIRLHTEGNVENLIAHLKTKYKDDKAFISTLETLEKLEALKQKAQPPVTESKAQAQTKTTSDQSMTELKEEQPIAVESDYTDLLKKLEEKANTLKSIYNSVHNLKNKGTKAFTNRPNATQNDVDLFTRLNIALYRILAYPLYMNEFNKVTSVIKNSGKNPDLLLGALNNEQALYQTMLEEVLAYQAQIKSEKKEPEAPKVNIKIQIANNVKVEQVNSKVKVTTNVNIVINNSSINQQPDIEYNDTYNNIALAVGIIGGIAITTALYYGVFKAVRSAIFGSMEQYSILQNVASLVATEFAIKAATTIIVGITAAIIEAIEEEYKFNEEFHSYNL